MGKTGRFTSARCMIGIMLLLTMFTESFAVVIVLTPPIMKRGAPFGLDPIYLGMPVVIATQIGASLATWLPNMFLK